MRRILLVLPNLLGPVLREERLPNLEVLTECGRITRLAPAPRVETPEALYLGMLPNEGQMRQGPLTVSALGADPPERSTHFHLSMGSLQDGVLRFIEGEYDLYDLHDIYGFFSRLSTKTLTVLAGEGTDHGLVWEGLGDLGTTSAVDAEGKAMRQVLPEGDNEVALRRLIDDSVNLLMETETNRRREEEGLPPLNVLWPWGHGIRRPVPNLILRRGEQATVESPSLRLAGLTRLTGYRHENRAFFGPKNDPRLGALAKRAVARDLSILVFDPAAYPKDDEERVVWFLRELDRTLLDEVVRSNPENPVSLTLLAPGSTEGLALQVVTPLKSQNSYPFDERSLDERRLPTQNLHEAVTLGL